MFEESNIQEMVDRLGWSENENLLYVAKINDENKIKVSGLTLNNYHKLVTLENIHQCQPDDNIDSLGFNSYLKEILDNVCREILTDVFVMDSRAEKNKDYSGTISEMISAGYFDKCIGYCHAVKIVEVLASTVRSNRIETIAGYKYSSLMGELKGFSTTEGVLVSKGLLHYCESSRKEIKDNFHGFSGAVICDATNEW